MKRIYVFRRAVVYEPKRPLHAFYEGILGGSEIAHDYHLVETPEEIRRYATSRSVPVRSRRKKVIDLVCIICSSTYLRFVTTYNDIRGRFPDTKFVLCDEKPKAGCACLAEKLSISGCCTYHDSRDDILECIKCVFCGRAAVSPVASRWLYVDPQENSLRGKAEHLTYGVHELKGIEWDCFIHLLSEGTLDEMTRSGGVSERYLANVKTNIRQKLNVKKTPDIIRIGHETGFLGGK